MPELMYKHFRIEAGKPAERAAEELSISPRTLHRYESGEISPPPEIVYQMADIYHAPAIIRWYRASICPIGRKLEPPVLNNIDTSPLARFFKYAEELEEAVPAAREMTKMMVNKRSALDFNDEEISELEWLTEQVLTDIFQGAAEAWEAYMDIFGVDAGEEAMNRHRQKMMERGYLQTKKKPARNVVFEEQAVYTVKEKAAKIAAVR